MGPIACDLDLEAPGKRTGNLRLTHSDNAHALSIIPIPVAVIAGGEGPSVVLSAGTHGNEYEGQVILRELVRELTPESVNGRLVVLPSLNMPAGARRRAGISSRRREPEPGVSRRSGPRAHGGDRGFRLRGDTPALRCPESTSTPGAPGPPSLPLVFLCRCEDDDVFARSAALAEAFGAPWTYLVTDVQGQGGFDPCAQDQGVAFISTELGGGGRLGGETLRIGRLGWCATCLAHLGVIDSEGGER